LSRCQSAKRGNAAEELEDAIHFDPKPDPPGSPLEGPVVLLAIADGATESSYSRDWATMLVRDYCNHPFHNAKTLCDHVVALSERWRAVVARKGPLPWYAEEKVRSGAFATFLGLEIRESDEGPVVGGAWNAVAVGDSCLFHTRRHRLVESFPLVTSSQFGNNPELVPTDPRAIARLAEHVQKMKNGQWMNGDVFILASDALAAWCLREHERGGEPWRVLVELGFSPEDSEGSLTRLFESLLDSGAIKNDDLSVVIARLSAG
jgi:hypothetical protein